MSKNQVQPVPTVPMQFQNYFIAVTPDKTHDFLMSTEEVAKGYSVSVNSIHSHKKRHLDEILENTHFLSLTQNAGVNEMPIKKIYWTKRGVIRLGMFIKSQRAVKFRDWAENLILEATEKQAKQKTLPRAKMESLPEPVSKFEKISYGVYKEKYSTSISGGYHFSREMTIKIVQEKIKHLQETLDYRLYGKCVKPLYHDVTGEEIYSNTYLEMHFSLWDARRMIERITGKTLI